MVIFLILFGAVIALPGMRWLGMVALFYMGYRRDLYFERERDWKRQAQVGGAAMLWGISFVAAGLSFYAAPFGVMSIGLYFLIFIYVFGAPAVMTRFPPRWLRQLEDNRSPEELQVVQTNGRGMLTSRPQTFRRIISSDDGWECWLLTLTHATPLSVFDLHMIHAEHALGNRNHVLARGIAEQIIAARPDRSLGYHLRARALLQDYRFAEAAQELDICIQLEPHNVEFYYRRARVHLMLDNMQAAHADLRRASALAPDNERLRVLRDIAAKRQKQPGARHPHGGS